MIRKDVAIIDRKLCDLNPLVLGEEQCPPGSGFGPAERYYTLIHFVVRGEGFFLRGGVEYPVKEGEAFLIRPHEITTYWASETNPWHYQWIGFDGALSARYAELPPVFPYTTNWAEKMLLLAAERGASVLEYTVTAQLHLMYADFFAGKEGRVDYVASVKSYVDTLYMQPLRVEEIAANMSLNRRYLSRIFKEKMGMSIQEYIVAVRMKEAKRLLSKGFRVFETAQLCGYEDAANFSKIFKRECGLSPAAYRK